MNLDIMARISKHKILLFVSDLVVINLSFCFALWLQYRSGIYFPVAQFPFSYLPMFAIASLILVLFFQLHGLYKYQLIENPYNQFIAIAKSTVKAYLVFIVLIFLLKHQLVIQRVTLLLSFVTLGLGLVLYRIILVPKVYRYLKSTGRVKKHIIIVGAGERGRKLAKTINEREDSYFRVIGFVDDKSQFHVRSFHGIPVLGPISSIQALAQNHHPDALLVAINSVSHNRLLEIIDHCKQADCPVHVVSDLYQVIPNRLQVEQFDGIPTFQLKLPRSYLLYNLLKRTFDVVGSFVLLVALLPLFAILAVVIKLTSRGPVFYKTTVIGRDGKPFVWYKFRSMYVNTDDRHHRRFVRDLITGRRKEGNNKITRDPRVTPVGRIIRRFSIDELPQLFNVLKGDMSLIGPRPCLPFEYELMKEWHRRRFQITPGMTGLWQVCGRSEVAYDDMVVMDLYYIENRSFWLDFEILLKTVPVVLTGRGGY